MVVGFVISPAGPLWAVHNGQFRDQRPGPVPAVGSGAGVDRRENLEAQPLRGPGPDPSGRGWTGGHRRRPRFRPVD